MFTGIVQQQGTLVSREDIDGDIRLVVDVPLGMTGRVDVGDSIAVNGVCLTVAGGGDGRVQFDVSAETLSRTQFGRMAPGARLNLEPALSASDPVGGHFVTGHVDGLGDITRLEPDGRSHRLEIAAPESLARYIAFKGCITVDGVSLTVNEVNDARFGVNVVPHTWSVTNMRDYAVGARVHLEVDLIARYLERLIGGAQEPAAEPDITTDFLSRQGFLPPLDDAEPEEDGERRDSRSERPE
ncbi:MAG: riboflavin synthase [Gammaproteobacteria bacterium]|nr:riboflavin synthase [Gammaproteobacteria bacterium]